MVPRDNSTLAFSTELLNYIIAFATHGKSGHYKIFDSLKIPVKVMGGSLLIHEFTYSLFIGLCSVKTNMTNFSYSYHSIKLIHCGAPQRDVLSDKMVF